MSVATNITAGSNASYVDPARPTFWGLLAILVFVLVFVVWGNVAPLSGAAIAQGHLQVEAQRQSVQHPYGGIVSRLLVGEGQYVERGQALIELNETEARAKVDVANAEVVTLLAQQARLIAERDGTGIAALEDYERENEARPLMQQAIANERAVLIAREKQYEAEEAMLASKVGQLREKVVGLRAQVDGLARQEASIEEETVGARELVVAGYGPKTRLLALERNSAQLLADRGSRIAEISAAEQAISEAQLAIARLERDRVAEVTDKIRQTQSQLAEALPRLAAARDVVDRTIIRAPMSGSIVELSVFTEGGVIDAGSRLMDIIPADKPMIVDARLQLYDINDVKPGSDAEVNLTGVPRAERPELTGEVVSVSADKMTDPASGRSYFSVRVRLRPEEVANSNVRLQPGMPAEVVVTTEARTLATYLLSPLLDEIGRAFREK